MGGVNSLMSMPTLRSTHSKGSYWPVAIAIWGMFPSCWLRGRRVSSAGSAIEVQAVTFGIFTSRRQRPIWMTSGMLSPTGTFFRVNFPSGPVSTVISGEPDTGVPHRSQATPAGNGASGLLGT